MTTVTDETERVKFARDAALGFSKHPEWATFGEVAAGHLIALRWGMGGDCVVVVRIDPDTEPVNYQGLVKEVGG